MRCRLFFVLLVLFLSPLRTVFAAAELHSRDQGHGKVSMQGEIVDTPCAIAIEDREQTIELLAIPVAQLIHDGAGPAKQLTIKLINCVLHAFTPDKPGWSRFQVTFDGPGTYGQLFALPGNMHGMGLEISDSAGKKIVPGVPSSGKLFPGSQSLVYYFRLVGNNQKLRPGSYHSTIRFKLDYF